MTAAAACSGGGGDGPSPEGPRILGASFVGPATPAQAGNRIWLFLSEDVQLNAAGAASDLDFTLTAGATLGAITVAPNLISSQTLELTLGVGVLLAPGATTITWSAENDIVKDGEGNPGSPGTPVVIGWSDGTPPTLANVTIAAIDDELNGTGPAGGRLQVPPSGWTLELAFADDQAVDHVAVLANATVQTPAGAQPPGTDLYPFLTAANVTATNADYTVPTGVAFPFGDITLTCAAIDTSGLASAAAAFPLRIARFTDALRPFETNANPRQLWYVDFARDRESFTATAVAGGAVTTATAGANGISDFEDLLRILGLNVADPILIGAMDSNEVARGQFEQRMLEAMALFYDGANVEFTVVRPSASFGSSASVPYSSFGHSQISVAGSPTSPGTLGVAIYDLHNETQDNDTLFDYQGTRLGIFLFTIVEAGLQPPSSSAFRLTFDPFVPELGGTAIGDDPADGQRLAGTLTDARAIAIDTAIDALAQFTAVVLAHECGHSMGLVANGPMPTGLYGNDPTNFPGSMDGHIRTDSLFPPGATNLMSPSLSYSSTLHPATAFNSLNMAYLREQVFYGN